MRQRMRVLMRPDAVARRGVATRKGLTFFSSPTGKPAPSAATARDTGTSELDDEITRKLEHLKSLVSDMTAG